MKHISPGCLLKVEWVDDPDVNAEWGLNILDLEDDENIVMFIKWRPEVFNSKDVISFQCLYQDKIYNCSTIAIIEIL